jgi:enoyl-CoA hydratase/carnithine racemase
LGSIFEERAMPTYDTIMTEISDGIMTITLNRPEKMNAFTAGMMQDMVAAFDVADADDAVRAVIVTGSGERAFCAGADLSAGAATFDYAQRSDRSDNASAIRADGSVDVTHQGARDSGGRLTLRIFNCKKPVIGAINGAAVGIGATMQLPMDFRLASTTARFGFVFAKRGIVPEAASSWFLPRLVGISKALDWCYSGRVFGAEEALAGGLIRSVHAPEDLLIAARNLAHELTAESAPASAHPSDDVADARREPPDGGPQTRQPGDLVARGRGRRQGRGRLLPRKARGPLSRHGQPRHAPFRAVDG